MNEARLHAVLRAAQIDPERLVSWTRLREATFNTAYRIRLADGSGLVLKVAPDPANPVLGYERDIMRTEAMFYVTAARAIPVPEVVNADFSRKVLDRDFLLMTELPGTNWHARRDLISKPDRAKLRTELGRAIAALSQVTGEEFGYPQGKMAANWRTAFTAMLQSVLHDARRFNVDLPPSIELLWLSPAVLDEVRTPVLVHFDLWPGNILLDAGAISGFVDGERAFWGDPLAELVSIALFGDIEQDADFLAGYRSAGVDIAFDQSVRTRLALYRSYLYLIMLVEAVPRGHSGPEQAKARAQLHQALQTLSPGTTP